MVAGNLVAELSYTLVARGPGATGNTPVQGNGNGRSAHTYIVVYVYRLREDDRQKSGSSRNDWRDYPADCNDWTECHPIENGSGISLPDETDLEGANRRGGFHPARYRL